MHTAQTQSLCTPPGIKTAFFVAPSGVRIGYEVWGSGPSVALIHGAFSNQRTNWQYVRPLLSAHVTGYAISRRGRGGTDTTAGHALTDEIADAVALIHHIGKPVHLLGHSYGALVALDVAAAIPQLVRRVVLYEAPWPHIFNVDTIAPLISLAKAGDWQELAMRFFSDVLSVPQAELDAAQGTENWHNVIANTPASFGDLHALSGYRFDLDHYRGLSMPVLLQTGSESPDALYVTDALASILPAATVNILEGQAHDAMTTAPEQYAASILDFLLHERKIRK